MKFGYTNESLDFINHASSIAPDDIAIWLTTAEYRRKAGQFAKSLEALLQAERLAETDEERDVVVRNRLDVLSESGTLAAEIERMAAGITSRPDATANDWTLLARYYEKNSQPDEAVASITQALKVEEQPIPALTTAARLLEASGDYAGSCEYSRRLAAVDRRASAVHWRNVARLEGAGGGADPLATLLRLPLLRVDNLVLRGLAVIAHTLTTQAP